MNRQNNLTSNQNVSTLIADPSAINNQNIETNKKVYTEEIFKSKVMIVY